MQPFYSEPAVCQMNCRVFARDNGAREVTLKEIDVVAWNDPQRIGEAYECKVRPKGLQAIDCFNLLALRNEGNQDGQQFATGVASFDEKRMVDWQLDDLADAYDKADDFRVISSYGWDNLLELG